MYFAKRLIPTTAMLVVSLGGTVDLYTPQMAAAQSETRIENRPAEQVLARFKNENEVLQQLNLTPEQTQKIQAIQEQYLTELEQPRTASFQAVHELTALMEGDASAEQVREKRRQVQELQQLYSNLIFEHKLAIRDVLTLEQRRQQAAIIRDQWKTLPELLGDQMLMTFNGKSFLSELDVENKVLQQLNLTPEQTQKIQAIEEQYRTEREQHLPALIQAHHEFQALMEGDASAEQVREKRRQVQELQQLFWNLSIERRLAIRDVLTLEQRRQQAAIMRDRSKLREILYPTTGGVRQQVIPGPQN